MKTYIARFDNGHDFGTFEFESDHKANSEDNKADAKAKARLKYGKIARNWKIIDTVAAD